MIYRRLWFVLLVVAFAVTAPMVVFYTAGYRWNPKKWTIERNGTLIFDTDPTGATILLNGERLASRTPLTRTDIAPGVYHVRLEKEGYISWEKTIEVRPERATFVTGIWLWAQQTPSRIVDGEITAVAASPDGRRLAALQETARGTDLVILRLADNGVFGFFGGGNSEEARIPFPETTSTGTARLLWDRSGETILGEHADGSSWVARVADAGISPLPAGIYRWENDALVGVWEGERLAYVPSEGMVRRTALTEGALDQEGDYLLAERSGGGQMVVEQGKEEIQFTLPAGTWTFAGREEGWLLLRERTRGHWLAFNPRDAERVTSASMPAQRAPLPYRREGEMFFLSFGTHELWLAGLDGNTELLLRSSDALTDTAWHQEGRYLFYTTTHQVAALGLDAQNGRVQTTLATFDQIVQMTVAGTTLYVAGEKDGQTGLWMLNVEP